MFALTSFVLRSKIILNRNNILIYFAILFIFASVLHTNISKPSGIKVGFVTNDGSYSSKFINEFQLYNKNIINVNTYKTTSDMIIDVKKGIIDTGYVIPEAFYDKKNSIETYVSPNSLLLEFNNIFITTILIQANAGQYGTEIISKVLQNDNLKTTININKLNKNYLKKAPFMNLKFVEQNGYNQSKPSSVNIFIGISCLICILITSLLTTIDNESFNPRFYKRINNQNMEVKFILGNMLSYSLFSYIILFSLQIVVFLFNNVSISNINILNTLIFSFVIVLFSFFINYFIVNKNNYIIFICIYFFLSIVFSGIFINIGSFIQSLAILNMFFLTHYFIMSIDGNYTPLMILFVLLLISTYFIYFKTNVSRLK